MGSQQDVNVIPKPSEFSCDNENEQQKLRAKQNERKRDTANSIENPHIKIQRNINDEETYSSDSDSDYTENNNSVSSIDDRMPSATQNNTNKSKLQPPIVVLLTNEHNLLTVKHSLNEISKDIIYKSNGKQLNILVRNKTPHEAVTKSLKNKNIKFYSYARKEDLKPKLILKGLPLIATEIISEEIKQFNINLIKTQLLKAKNNSNINQATYLITLNSLEDLKQTIKIKQIYQVIITWEKYKKIQNSTQCFKCQRHGHSRSNCFHEPRCLECAGYHLTSDCSAEINQENFKCVNCIGNHKSNAKLCPTYVKYIESKNKNNSTQKKVLNKLNTLNNERNNIKTGTKENATYQHMHQLPEIYGTTVMYLTS